MTGLRREDREAPSWFRGAIDLHVHSRPSIFPRLLSDSEVVERAARAGMGGVILKAHEGSTVERAQIARDAVAGTDFAVGGGVVLNHFVGGINAAAVELGLAQGGNLVWMPTIHSGNHMGHYGEAGFSEQRAGFQARPVEPLTVLDASDNLLPEAKEVLEVVAAHPEAVLNNGHLGAQETAALFREARRLGIERLMVAHPELALSGFDLDFQKEMAGLGALIERCCLPHLERWGGFPLERTAREIREIGPESCVLSTDFGQVDSPPPAEGFEWFAGELLARGVSEAEIVTMIRRNPAELLGLE